MGKCIKMGSHGGERSVNPQTKARFDRFGKHGIQYISMGERGQYSHKQRHEFGVIGLVSKHGI